MPIPAGQSNFYGIGEDPASVIKKDPLSIRFMNYKIDDAIMVMKEGNFNTLIENNDFSELKKQTLGIKLFVVHAELGVNLQGVAELDKYLDETVSWYNNNTGYVQMKDK